MQPLKINAFHCGIPANTRGIGDYINTTIQTVPITTKAVMNTASLMDIQPLLQSGKSGHMIWRMDRFRNGDNDVPRYGTDPQQEALRYWNEVLAVMPPELDKSLCWIELVNEPDHEQMDWLGELFYELGQLALRDNMKVVCGGLNSGEPDESDWYENGIVKFLRLCAQHPEQVAISLHEYSFNTDIWNQYPYLVGRFRFMLDACNNLGIPYPTTFITEWGWGKDIQTYPGDVQAVQDLIDVGKVYAKYPCIKGVVIWCLDTGVWWQGLGDALNRIMPDIQNAVVTTWYDVEVDNGNPTDPPLNYKAIPVLMPQDSTLAELEQVHTEEYANRRTITQSHDEAIRLVQLGKQGSYTIVYDIDRWPAENQAEILAVPHELRTL